MSCTERLTLKRDLKYALIHIAQTQFINKYTVTVVYRYCK